MSACVCVLQLCSRYVYTDDRICAFTSFEALLCTVRVCMCVCELS